MNEDEFTKLFKYIQKRFDSMDQKLDDKSSQASLDRLKTACKITT